MILYSPPDSDLSGAFALLHEAETTLKKIVYQKFEAAIRSGDKNAVDRFVGNPAITLKLED